MKYVDPSGHIATNEVIQAQDFCLQLAEYGIHVMQDWGLTPGSNGLVWTDGLWTLGELRRVLGAVRNLSNDVFGGDVDATKEAIGGVSVMRVAAGDATYGAYKAANWYDEDLITFRDGALGMGENEFDARWTVVHELAHWWDHSEGHALSREMKREVGAGYPPFYWLAPSRQANWYDPGSSPPPCGVDGNFNKSEDFAEAVTAYVYPTEARQRASDRDWPYQDPTRGYSYAGFHDTPRGQYIDSLTVDSQ